MTQPSAPDQDLPTLGKIHPAFFERVIKSRLGVKRDTVLVGPQHGVDIGVVRLGNGRVMAITTDPFFVAPELGWERAAWFAVHILASDITTSGLAPEYMSIDLNLPPSMTQVDLETMWTVVHQTCEELGIAVVTGHTGRYQGCGFPMIGGCTLISTGEENAYVAGGMSRPGDQVLITKGAAIEAAGLFAVSFPQRIEQAYGSAFAQQAQEIFWQMSTVREALAAVSVGVRDQGVTAMHDATECGVYGGLVELAQAAGIGMRIEAEKIPVKPEIAQICQLFEIDPYTSISEGTLLLTCVPQASQVILERIREAGILAECIGICTEGSEVMLIEGAEERVLGHPRIDPFWEAFARAAQGNSSSSE